MAKITVTKNVWGNYKCKIGGKVIEDTGEEFVATRWLSEQLDAHPEYELSRTSYIPMAMVKAYRDTIKVA